MFPPALSVGVGKAPREETVGVCGQGNLSRLIGGPMTGCDAVDGSHPPASRCHVLENFNRSLMAHSAGPGPGSGWFITAAKPRPMSIRLSMATIIPRDGGVVVLVGAGLNYGGKV